MQSFNNILTWLKSNKLLSILILVIFYLLFGSRSYDRVMFSPSSEMNFGLSNSSLSYDAAESSEFGGKIGRTPAPITGGGAPPVLDVADRKVVTNISLVAVVKNVRDTINIISNEITSLGGYVVNKSINTPESLESGSINVRVPSEKLEEFLANVRGLTTKVVNEDVSGTDITDNYIDIEERLNVLNKNKARLEEIMTAAVDVDDILRVQQQIFNLQDQIDRLKGQLQYLDGTTKTSLVSISLTTDELSLPYTPDKPFRPEVILKEATRALIKDLRGLAASVIWISVYAVIWIPILIIVVVIYKLYSKKSKTENNTVNTSKNL